MSSIEFSWICDAGVWNHICVNQVILCLKILNGEIYEGHLENKDCLSIKKNKIRMNLLCHYYRPEVIFLHSRHEHSGTFHSM